MPASDHTAFGVFVGEPGQWLPPAHRFIEGPAEIMIEPRLNGRFYERGPDGHEIVRGVVVAWEPPTRLTITWRVGPGWQPVFTDDEASRITVEFSPVDDTTTEVTFTYTELYRHGDMAPTIYAALTAPGPAETLERYAEAVANADDDE